MFSMLWPDYAVIFYSCQEHLVWSQLYDILHGSPFNLYFDFTPARTVPLLLGSFLLYSCQEHLVWSQLYDILHGSPFNLYFDFTPARTVPLLLGSFWWLKVWCNNNVISATSLFLSTISLHGSSSIWTWAFAFVISSATFKLSVWNTSDCLSPIYIISFSHQLCHFNFPYKCSFFSKWSTACTRFW